MSDQSPKERRRRLERVQKAQRRMDDAEEAAKYLDGHQRTRLAALVRALIRAHKSLVRKETS